MVLTEVAVCMFVRSMLAVPWELRIIAANEVDSFKYLYSKNCRVKYLELVIRKTVSMKEFHWLTAAKIAMVARIGVISGKMMRMNKVMIPAPSISADSCSTSGMDSTKVLTNMT
ncbi:hypothetical protein D3C87_1823600 [compost metagenome]